MKRCARTLVLSFIVLGSLSSAAHAYYAYGRIVRNEARWGLALGSVGNHSWGNAYGSSSSGYYSAVENWGWGLGVNSTAESGDCYKFGSTGACSGYYRGWSWQSGGYSWYSTNAPWTTAGRQLSSINNVVDGIRMAYAINGVCHTATNRGLYYYNVPWIDGALDWAMAGASLSSFTFTNCGLIWWGRACNT